MNTKLKLALAAGIALGGAGLLTGSASAMPMSGLDKAIATTVDTQSNVQEAAWICRPWGCHWVPGWRYWGGPGYGYGYGYGWHHWHHWHHWW
jgi:hypothetical protein